MLAKRNSDAAISRAARNGANANWLSGAAAAPAKVHEHEADAAEPVSMAIYQLVAGSLDGPLGLHPETFLAALGALAGYSARWSVRAAIATGALDNDFHVPDGTNRPHVLVSGHVNAKVCALTGRSVASIVATQLIQAGADWLPDIDTMLQHNFEAINSPTYPDYTVPEKHYPQIPPQTLLLMLWEKTSRALRAAENGAAIAPLAIAGAAAHACIVHAGNVPLGVAGQLVLETAIAMSKLDYAV